MTAELRLLHGLLAVGFIVAPIMAHRFFLSASRGYRALHAVAFASAALAIGLDVPVLAAPWLAFCLGGLALFAKMTVIDARRPILALATLAPGVPFAFSVIAALWFFCGANDLKLLGYGPTFSYYAALHGTVLGWIFGGCIAMLVRLRARFFRAHFACLGLTFASFLLIAFGIDGAPVIKPLGVAGITVAIPGALVLFLIGAWPVSRGAFGWGLLSLVSVGLTMILAWQNEVGALWIAEVCGVRSMVALHGVLNGVIAAPAFVIGVALLQARMLSAAAESDPRDARQ